jgi:hypothetical protein
MRDQQTETGEPLCAYAYADPSIGESPAHCERVPFARLQHFDDPEDRPLVCQSCADHLLETGDYEFPLVRASR